MSKLYNDICTFRKGVISMANVEEKVENLIKEKVQDLGYNLYDVQYVKEGPDYYLRVFIEKPDGSIDLDDCEKVNDGINDLLDQADYIKEQYFLEVSSTGIEKVLRKNVHLKDNIGNKIQINLFKPMDIRSKKQKEIVGILNNFDENNIYISIENENLQIERKNISQIKTVFDWDSIS